MAWSIFQQGGGNGAAYTWAQNLLAALGAPQTQGNEQFIYDWELSEGGGGNYNPLNQGPVPGQPQLTTSGSQYGGGAANYANYADGIQGAVDYLNMSNYTQVKADLMANNPTGARTALFDSPWAASHYGYGADFSNAPLPGQATSLLGDTGNTQGQGSTTGTVQNANWLSNLFSYNGQISDLKSLFGALSGKSGSSIGSGLQNLVIRGALIVFGAVILIIGVLRLTGNHGAIQTIVEAPAIPAKAAASAIKGKAQRDATK